MTFKFYHDGSVHSNFKNNSKMETENTRGHPLNHILEPTFRIRISKNV